MVFQAFEQARRYVGDHEIRINDLKFCGALDMSGKVLEWCLNESRTSENTGLGGGERRAVRVPLLA